MPVDIWMTVRVDNGVVDSHVGVKSDAYEPMSSSRGSATFEDLELGRNILGRVVGFAETLGQ